MQPFGSDQIGLDRGCIVRRRKKESVADLFARPMITQRWPQLLLCSARAAPVLAMPVAVIEMTTEVATTSAEHS